MQFIVRENQGVEECCITLKGNFGFDVARAFLAEMKKRPTSGKTRIVFDLSGVDHLESSGLGAMLLVVERMESQHRPIIRCGNERVWAVLQIAHMERLFDLVPVGPLADRAGAASTNIPYQTKVEAPLKATV
jgi:anti-anti-sigma factor